jgi:hypothetical protein
MDAKPPLIRAQAGRIAGKCRLCRRAACRTDKRRGREEENGKKGVRENGREENVSVISFRGFWVSPLM